MKKLITLSLSLLLIIPSFISCADKGNSEGVVTDDLIFVVDDGIHTEFDGFYMELDSVGESSVSVTWHNDTDLEPMFGESYTVEFLGSNGKWVSVQKEEMMFDAIALMIPKGGELEKGYSLKSFDLSRVGTYRLRSEFHVDGEKYSTWVEFSVTAENAELINRIPDTDVWQFAHFLDREGFVGGMTQGQLLDLAEKYAEGLDPSIVPVFWHYDGEYGGGCEASGELFGYKNDYRNEDGKVRYENSFYAKVEIPNLDLPCGIRYGDKFAEVLDKLSIDRNIYFRYNSGTNIENLPLYNDGKATLTLVNWALTPMPVEMLYHYELIYTDTTDTLTRTVKLSFTSGDNRLARIDIKTVDEYEK